jgi:hypothetical protein
MKKLLFSLVLVTNVSFSQDYSYSMINQSQNKFLERYNIKYTGPYVRYMVESGNVNKLSDPKLIKQYNISFKEFVSWNNVFETVPSDTFAIMSFSEYLSSKETVDIFVDYIFSASNDKILKIKSINVNDRMHNVKTIEIIEYYAPAGMDNFSHVIFYKDFSDFWNIWVYDETDTELDCAPCMIP